VSTPSANDESFREIQLNGKQLVFLFMAATVVSVVIFLCGVLVGRGARSDRAPAEDVAAADIAADPGATPPPQAAGPPSTAVPPAPPEELTYAERLQRVTPPVETLKTPPPKAPEPPPVAAEPAARPSPAPLPTARPNPATAAAAGNAQDRTPPPAMTAISASDPTGPGFAVQVAALDDRQSADALAKQLIAKGYPAFVMDPVKGTPLTKYRVRVGKYKNRKDADAVSARLEKVEQFAPWIAR
jgi:cell division septation protein DedD